MELTNFGFHLSDFLLEIENFEVEEVRPPLPLIATFLVLQDQIFIMTLYEPSVFFSSNFFVADVSERR